MGPRIFVKFGVTESAQVEFTDPSGKSSIYRGGVRASGPNSPLSMAAVAAKRYRSWVFTLNHPTEHDKGVLEHLVADGRCRYLVGQMEVGENGTEHFQGYVQWGAQKTFQATVGELPGNPHVGERHATHEKARHYVLKPHEGCNCEHCVKARGLPNRGRLEGGLTVEAGDPIVGQGERTEIQAVMTRVREGATDREIAEEFAGSWVRYHRAFERYRAILQPVERDWITHTTVLWGPPGTGKTHRAHELAGAGAYWVTYGTNAGAPQYYDGYDGQECVVFDEFFGQIRKQEMCKLLDRYPCNVPTRGGQSPWLAKRVIITSNVCPEEWWRRLGLGAMERRLEGEYGVVVHMPNVYVDRVDPVVSTETEELSESLVQEIGQNAQRRGEWSPRGQYMQTRPEGDPHGQGRIRAPR